jgi:hypothetical protein
MHRLLQQSKSTLHPVPPLRMQPQRPSLAQKPVQQSASLPHGEFSGLPPVPEMQQIPARAPQNPEQQSLSNPHREPSPKQTALGLVVHPAVAAGREASGIVPMRPAPSIARTFLICMASRPL